MLASAIYYPKYLFPWDWHLRQVSHVTADFVIYCISTKRVKRRAERLCSWHGMVTFHMFKTNDKNLMFWLLMLTFNQFYTPVNDPNLQYLQSSDRDRLENHKVENRNAYRNKSKSNSVYFILKLDYILEPYSLSPQFWLYFWTHQQNPVIFKVDLVIRPQNKSETFSLLEPFSPPRIS